MVAGGLSIYQTHSYCIAPAVHFGPPCGTTLVPLEMLLDAAPEQVIRWQNTLDNVTANLELERIETFDCNGDLLAAASFESLGLSVGQLQ